jgi:hypothetical protein
MTRLFPALEYLYLHDSSLDLYLKKLRSAIPAIPLGVLQLEYDCRPIITDYSPSEEAENCGITLGWGFHKSDFNQGRDSPREGLVFCLNPPITKDITNIRIPHTERREGIISIHSSFMIGENRFILTDKEFDLDLVICGELTSGEIYKKHG